jgi:hypothetical protein
MYSPLIVAIEGTGVAVGGSDVLVAIGGWGVLEVPKEAHAINPKTRIRIN